MVATGVSGELQVWWWSALAVGLVVAVVVVILLHWLLRLVKGIEDGLSAIWSTGKAVARNTATTWMLAETARLTQELKQEALRHASLMTGRARRS